MRVFERMYQSTMRLSRSRRAPLALSILSFLESFILPFPPPDVMLAPMSLAQPKKAVWFATLTLIASVVGGIIGYLIGAFAFDLVEPLVERWGYQQPFDQAIQWFEVWGFWAVLVAGFSPVPYKLFTISAGLLTLAFIPFILASVIGRGARFFLVAMVLAFFGPAIEVRLMRYIELIGWGTVVLLCLAIGYYSLS
jgi:membrane protein YqaA with SNARE-associated domain